MMCMRGVQSKGLLRTLLVQNVPSQYCTNATFKAFWERLYPKEIEHAILVEKRERHTHSEQAKEIEHAMLERECVFCGPLVKAGTERHVRDDDAMPGPMYTGVAGEQLRQAREDDQQAQGMTLLALHFELCCPTVCH